MIDGRWIALRLFIDRIDDVSRSILVSRRAAPAIAQALAIHPVVLINGAHRVGKSTVVRAVAAQRAAAWRDLDLPQDRQELNDPVGFVSCDGLMVIDEIQRAPELLAAIKTIVDADPRSGRFLLTSSVRSLPRSGLPDTLSGHMQTIELWPFSQGEIDRNPDGFIDAAFGLGPAMRHHSTISRADYADRVLRGGLPDAVARPDAPRRGRFLDSYVRNLIDRAVIQGAEMGRLPKLAALTRLLAARSGRLVPAGSLESELHLSRPTMSHYLQLLEEVFLIKRIPGWPKDLESRTTSAAKFMFVDSGVASSLLALDHHTFRHPGAPLGSMLENFVLSELARQITWSQERVELYHYCDHNQVEVNTVLENRRCQAVGVGVKAASAVRPNDFRGLRRLAQKLGENFVLGVVFYLGHATLAFGPRLRAMPVSALWQLSNSGLRIDGKGV